MVIVINEISNGTPATERTDKIIQYNKLKVDLHLNTLETIKKWKKSKFKFFENITIL